MTADVGLGQTDDQDWKHYDDGCLGRLPGTLGCGDCILWIVGH
jgi:hypothetical protein